MKTWFTADLHFNHKNVISLSNRPFRTLEEMNATLISRWNARVGVRDTVYVLGDFSFDKHQRHLPLLHGTKILILGNHDHRHRWKNANWHSVHDLLEVDVEGQRLVLCHYALRSWNNMRNGVVHLYGHSHGLLQGNSQCTDVGVDCWKYQPVSLTEIKEFLATQPKEMI